MNHLPEEMTLSRRRFLGIAAMSIAAAQLGMIGCAKEQSSEETQGAAKSEETNTAAQTTPLPMPVLAIGGAESSGDKVGETMNLTADDVQTLVIPGIGHWLAEQAPDEMVAALTEFLAPYREDGGGLR
jgi:pimeloyl-ACP methyl ester carboxylesterase